MPAMLVRMSELHGCGIDSTVFIDTSIFLGRKLGSGLISKCAPHPPPAFINQQEPKKHRANGEKSHAFVSMQRAFDVFISHAGEDKDTIAMPLYTCLQNCGVTAFLDREELQEGEDAPKEMIRAMETSPVGLFILSPEFAAKKWTMLELDCFLQRVKKADVVNDGRTRPALIPVFYRLTVADCRYEQLFRKYREVLLTTDFLERVEAGLATSNTVKSSLSSLSSNTGIENHIGATNEDSKEMEQIRLSFVEEICERVQRVVQRLAVSFEGTKRRKLSFVHNADVFKAYFYIPQLANEVLLNFVSIDDAGNPVTYEGSVLREVLRKNDAQGATRVISVLGSPGVGKSCLLRALAGNKDVKCRFPDGIYYMLLGVDATESTIVQELLKVIRCSGGHATEKLIREEWSLDIVIEKVAEWMRGRTYLLLVDDVWDDAAGASTIFSLLGIFGDNTHSAIVLTTRQESIAVLGDVVKIEPLQPCSEEAKDMLLRYSKLPELLKSDLKLDEVMRNILVRCGGLPVCLAAVGRGIAKQSFHYRKRKEVAMEVYYNQLRSGNRKIADLNVDGYPGLSAAYLASLTFLERQCRTILGIEGEFSLSEMHRALSVFERQATIPPEVLCRLWNLKDGTEAVLVLEAFVEVGLADIEVDYETGRKQLRLHDLAHDFGCACAQRKGETQIWHQRLLNGYMVGRDHCDRNRPWWELDDDAYIYNNLARHLFKSGRGEEALQLILSAPWTLRRHDCGGLRSCMRDFDISMKDVKRSRTYSSEEKHVLISGLSAVKHAVRDSWSVVNRNRNEFCFQMYGRLMAVADSLRPVNTYLNSFSALQSDPWLKPTKGYFGQPGQQPMKAEFVMSSPVIAVAEVFSGSIAAVTRHEVVMIEVEDMILKRNYIKFSRGIDFASFSCNGSKIVAGSRNGHLQVCDLKTGTLEHEITPRFDSSLCCVASSKDSARIAIGSVDKTIIVWDAKTDMQIGKTMRGHKRLIRSLAFSKDGTRIVSTAEDKEIRIWNAETGVQIGNALQGHRHFVWCAVVSNDGSRILSGSSDRTIRVWDVIAGKQVGPALQGHERGVRCLAVSDDGNLVVSGSTDKTVRVWDVKTETELGETIRAHDGSVLCVAISNDGKRVISGSIDQTVRVWNVNETGNTWQGHARWVRCVSLNKNGTRIVSGSGDKTVRVWDARTGMQLGKTLRGHSRGVRCVSISDDGRIVISGSTDGTIRVWDADCSAQIGRPLGNHRGAVLCVLLSEDAKHIISSSDDGTIRLWNVETRRQVGHSMRRHSAKVIRLQRCDNNIIESWDTSGSGIRWLVCERAHQGLVQISGIFDEDSKKKGGDYQVLCIQRQVKMITGSTSRTLATLPSEVVTNSAWCYNHEHQLLATGLTDGRVLVFRLLLSGT